MLRLHRKHAVRAILKWIAVKKVIKIIPQKKITIRKKNLPVKTIAVPTALYATLP